jgi:hypothetical protein
MALGAFGLNFVKFSPHSVANLHHQCHRTLTSFTSLLADTPDAVTDISLESHLRGMDFSLNCPGVLKIFLC